MRQWIEYAIENYRSKSSFGFQLAGELKERQIDTAIEQYARIVRPEEVVAILDTTLVKSGKSGFLITDKYLYSSYEKDEGPVELMSLKHAAVREDNNSYCILEYEDGRTREMYVSVFLDVADILEMAVSRRAKQKIYGEEEPEEKEDEAPSDWHMEDEAAEGRLQFGMQEKGRTVVIDLDAGEEAERASKAEEDEKPQARGHIKGQTDIELESGRESGAEAGAEDEPAIEIIGLEELEDREEEEEEPVWDTELARLEGQEPEEPPAEEHGEDEEPESSEQIIRKAEAGDRIYMYKAAEMLYAKRQTAKDGKEALRWYRESAKEKYVPAMLKLMQFYGEGELVKKNLTLSMSWAKKAAATGEPEGQYALVKAYIYGQEGMQETDKGLKILDEMAGQGDAAAGQMAAEIRQEIKDAKEKFRAGIRNPSTASGYYEMGMYCKAGDGYYTYPQEAVQYFKKAAQKEHIHAQYELAVAYHTGEGIKKDEAKSISWLKKAASKSHKEATELLGKLQENQRIKQEKAEFRHDLRQAEKGDAYAQSRVAERYLQGAGVKKDVQKGIEWYEKASETDEGYAARQLAGLYAEGKLVPADEERAAYWRMVGGILDEL